MRAIGSVVVVCLAFGCGSSDSAAPAAETDSGGTDSAAVDSALIGDSVATDSTSTDTAAADAPTTDAPGGCSSDFTGFTYTVSIKKDGAALVIPNTARRKCVTKDKELDMDFGDQGTPLPNGAYKFGIGFLGKTKQPTDDGFSLPDASFSSFVLYEGSATGVPTAYQNTGTPTTQTLTVTGGKLTYHYKGTFVENLKTTPTFALEVDIVDAPLN